MRRRDEAELPALAEQVGCLRVTQVRGEPVECTERNDRIESAACGLPGLEVRVDHRDARKGRQLALRRGCESLSELDAGDRIAPLGECQRRLAGAAADLDQACLHRKLRERSEVVEDLRRVVRPGAVVKLRHLVERRAQELLRCVRHDSMMPDLARSPPVSPLPPRCAVSCFGAAEPRARQRWWRGDRQADLRRSPERVETEHRSAARVPVDEEREGGGQRCARDRRLLTRVG